MSTSQTLMGGAMVVAFVSAIIQALSPSTPAVLIRSMSYDPVQDKVTLDRRVMGADVRAPWNGVVVDFDSEQQIEGCTKDKFSDFRKDEPEVQAFTLDQFASDGCLAKLKALPEGREFVLIWTVNPATGPSDQERTQPFTVPHDS